MHRLNTLIPPFLLIFDLPALCTIDFCVMANQLITTTNQLMFLARAPVLCFPTVPKHTSWAYTTMQSTRRLVVEPPVQLHVQHSSPRTQALYDL
jgi:hypothetical protein